MAKMPFVKHGFTIRPADEIAAALAISGLEVEQHHIEDKPIPRYLLVGSRPN
jgi:hypothetical protein